MATKKGWQQWKPTWTGGTFSKYPKFRLKLRGVIFDRAGATKYLFKKEDGSVTASYLFIPRYHLIRHPIKSFRKLRSN